ncbi:hypothetical protein VNO77_04186 [Canavalia gladiata]|uniref:Uncharacterized protein n=1 Tax=Canavalia gladiata TaxID=3824 RepID=A0AAN9MWX4_CANGL
MLEASTRPRVCVVTLHCNLNPNPNSLDIHHSIQPVNRFNTNPTIGLTENGPIYTGFGMEWLWSLSPEPVQQTESNIVLLHLFPH